MKQKLLFALFAALALLLIVVIFHPGEAGLLPGKDDADLATSPDPAPEPVLTEPPTLTVGTQTASIEAQPGTYSWHYQEDDGTGVGIEADAIHPLDAKDDLPILSPVYDPASSLAQPIYLQFATAPDQVSARCWSADLWGQPEAPATPVTLTANEQDPTIYDILLEDHHIYEITATWSGAETWGGTVHYRFHMTAPEPTP